MTIVKRMLGKHIDNIPTTELYQDAIREIGNIMLNACMGSIANVMSISLEQELPVLQSERLKKCFTAAYSALMKCCSMSLFA